MDMSDNRATVNSMQRRQRPLVCFDKTVFYFLFYFILYYYTFFGDDYSGSYLIHIFPPGVTTVSSNLFLAGVAKI